MATCWSRRAVFLALFHWAQDDNVGCQMAAWKLCEPSRPGLIVLWSVLTCFINLARIRPFDLAILRGAAMRRDPQWKLDRVLQVFEVQDGMAINVATECVVG